MSHHDPIAERFLPYLTGTADDTDRRELEREMLEDDGLFDELEALESEILDAWARGELDHETSARLAERVADSRRLAAKAETSWALYESSYESSTTTLPNEPQTSSSDIKSAPMAIHAPSWYRIAITSLVLMALTLLWLAWTTSRLGHGLDQLVIGQQALDERLRALETTVEQIEEESRKVARELARREVSDVSETSSPQVPGTSSGE